MLRFLLAVFLFLSPINVMAETKVGSFLSLGTEVSLTATRAWFTLRFDPNSQVSDVKKLLASTPWAGEHRIAVHCEADRVLLVELKQALDSEQSLIRRLLELEAHSQIEWAIAGAHTPDGRALGMDNQVLVLTHKAPKLKLFAIRAKRAGAELVKALPFTHGVLLRVPANTRKAVLAVAWQMRRFSDVLDAHPNFIRIKEKRKSSKKVLNDPYLSEQWYIWKIQAPAAWDVTLGSLDVIVAVIDDAIDVKHEEFQAAGKIHWDAAWDFNGGDNDPSPNSGDNHGTAVAGIAIATGDNGVGIAGVCPNCKFFPVRQGYGSYTDAQMFKHVADWGAHVVNNSWGYYYPPTAVSQAITNAVKFGRGGKGTMVVFAAGNYNEDIDKVQDISVVEGVVAVASTGYNDTGQGYSNWGKSVGISAPADGQVSTDISGWAGYSNGNYTSNFGGTSGAAPVISGAAGLVFSVNPDLTEAQVKQLLYTTADKVGKSGYDANGHSVYYGYGRVNANKAVAAAAGVAPGDPVIPPVDGGGGGGDNGGGQAGSCAGSCGGETAGGCWCDEQCVGYGDCCADVCAQCGLHCGNVDPPPEDPGGVGGENNPGNDPVQPDPVTPSKVLGEPCGSDKECVLGLFCQSVPGKGAYCAQPCTLQAADCPPGFECIVIGGQGACLVKDGMPESNPGDDGQVEGAPDDVPTESEDTSGAVCAVGAEPCASPERACQRGNDPEDTSGICENAGPLASGQICANDAECSTRFCETVQGNERRCLVPCENSARCAQGSTCVQLPEVAVVGACRWSPDNVGPAHVSGSSGSGCRSGPGHPAEGGVVFYLLLALLGMRSWLLKMPIVDIE
jgi:hypothetical protein